MRRTKIVATVGPATAEPGAMRQLLAAGVDVVRLNAAHADMATHAANARRVRELAQTLGRNIGILVDLPGPKIRSGVVAGDAVELESGEEFVLSGGEDGHGDSRQVTTTLPELAQWMRPGDDVYLADGAIVLRVLTSVGNDVRTEVVRGGTLRSRKGMHLPRAEAHVDPFTERDALALEMAIAAKADFIGLSFVRRAEDVERIRALLPKRGVRPALVPKIETAAAIDNLEGIIGAADAVMVARGDLGIQMPARRVPLLQKEIIRQCNMAGKPVITATQMLESMTRSPLPTRAEVNDVANAVLDGTDALMLSEETAVGLFAAETVRMMGEVAESAEEWPRLRADRAAIVGSDSDRVSWAVAHAAVQAAEDLGVAAILCPTRSGDTARRVAAFRPNVPIAGIAASAPVLGGLSLVWGVRPLMIVENADRVEQLRIAVEAARAAGVVRDGDLVALVFGSAGPRAGSTDSVRIVRV
ncbi:MAG TPA: pyruvate kinase [Accumulibacter sp.]|uniref:pyruvate kinase n=1 Tax=Accumulibacter sp. TaxID=2053492 RepID=UPI0025E388CB|nr:pyruvate kinase [Accumulibacter sp.]MCM8599610.1 pyruvate kinase [Accumulibacter sp.]MCM8663449.1 pyruvate kinase [Accumulibacter sp.]HNC51033.1 pyruvate kinase [Accumulibacter sp.]